MPTELVAVLYWREDTGQSWEQPEYIELQEFEIDGGISSREMRRWKAMIEEGNDRGFEVGWCRRFDSEAAEAEFAYQEELEEEKKPQIKHYDSQPPFSSWVHPASYKDRCPTCLLSK